MICLMSKRFVGTFAFCTFLLALPAWAQAPARGIPRASDGKPDLNGIWQVLNTAAWDLEDHTGSFRVPPGQGVIEGGEIPYQAAALDRKSTRLNSSHVSIS